MHASSPRPPTTARESLKSRAGRLFERLFGLDVRSLALVRMALGALVLADLAIRAGDLVALHADGGLLPRAAWVIAFPRALSLHAATGSPVVLGLLFAAHAAAALALFAGHRTRAATLVTWLLTVSLQARNPALLQAGDSLLALLLFWGLFVPLGATWSVDAAARPEATPAPTRVTSVGTAALALQMPAVYFFTGLLKEGPEWRSTFTAIQGALSDDFIASPAGVWLGHALPGAVLRGMTASVLAIELLLPLALLFPVRTARLRLFLLPALFVLQAGFCVCLRIGLFPLISTTGAAVLLPSDFWVLAGDRLARSRVGAACSRAAARLSRLAGELGRRHGAARPRPALGRLGAALCALCLAYAAADNVASVTGRPLPSPVVDVGHALHLGQSWKMFVHASTSHRWVVLDGTLEDGRHVDLLAADGRAPSFARPEVISDTFASYRWRKYLGRMMGKGRAARVEQRALATYLCRSWDDGAGARLVSVTGHRFDERVGAPAAEAPRHRELFEKACPARGHGKPARQGAAGPRLSQR